MMWQHTGHGWGPGMPGSGHGISGRSIQPIPIASSRLPSLGSALSPSPSAPSLVGGASGTDTRPGSVASRRGGAGGGPRGLHYVAEQALRGSPSSPAFSPFLPSTSGASGTTDANQGGSHAGGHIRGHWGGGLHPNHHSGLDSAKRETSPAFPTGPVHRASTPGSLWGEPSCQSQSISKFPHGIPGKRPKNVAVWQRWQVQTSSNRMQREQVLERDRQRQTARCEVRPPRQSASPARSHAASLFFAQLPGSLQAAELLPPGALRHVARPETRNMQEMPNSAVSFNPGSAQKAGRHWGSEAEPPSLEELPDGCIIFEGHELMALERAFDNFCNLVQPPTMNEWGISPPNDAFGRRTRAPTEDSPMHGHLEGGRMSVFSGSTDMGRVEPMVLRPMFCRFLLGARICGSANPSPANAKQAIRKYHDCLELFDRYAMRSGALVGMPRSHAIRVLFGIVFPMPMFSTQTSNAMQEGEARSSMVRSTLGSMSMGDLSIASDPLLRPAQVVHFLKETIPRASAQAMVRKKKLDNRIQQTVPVINIEEKIQMGEDGEIAPKSKIWPPLPPRSVPEKELSNWMTGVRQWVDELRKHSPSRLHALRAHTETVLRGELLASQLLEPEVLHFATRFRPLFELLFMEYADFSSPDPKQLWEKARRKAREEEEAEREKLESVAAAAELAAQSQSTPASRRTGNRSAVVGPSIIRRSAGSPPATNSSPTSPVLSEKLPGEVRRSPATIPEEVSPVAGNSDKSKFTSSWRTVSKSSDSITSRPPSASAEWKRQLGHMTFPAFFRFCVDFGLFPKHASFDEIKQIYLDAEATFALPRYGSPEAVAVEAAPVPAPFPAGKDRGGRNSPVGISTSSMDKHASEASQKASPSMSSKPLDREESKKAAAREAARRKAQRAAEAAAAAAAAAIASEEAKLMVDLRFMEKPVGELSSLEIETMMFLSSVDEWLTERFIRLPDVVDRKESEDEGKKWTDGDTTEQSLELEKEREVPKDRRSTVRSSAVSSPLSATTGGGDNLLIPLQSNMRPGHSKEETASFTADRWKPEATTSPPMSVSKVSVTQMLEVIRSMGSLNRPPVVKESDLVAMFRLLLGANADNLDPAIAPGDLQVALFSLDKGLKRAREAKERIQEECCGLLCKRSQQTFAEATCTKFFEALDQQLLERSRFPGADFPGADPEDIFAARTEFTPAELINIAVRIGVPDEAIPTHHALHRVLVALGGSKSKGTIHRSLIYRALAIAQENSRARRCQKTRGHLQVLAHNPREGPTTHVFGVPAFVECLLKLALHKLGNKGLSEIHRCSPSWWKCTWLLTLLTGHFAEESLIQRHNERIHRFADGIFPEAVGEQSDAESDRVESEDSEGGGLGFGNLLKNTSPKAGGGQQASQNNTGTASAPTNGGLNFGPQGSRRFSAPSLKRAATSAEDAFNFTAKRQGTPTPNEGPGSKPPSRRSGRPPGSPMAQHGSTAMHEQDSDAFSNTKSKRRTFSRSSSVEFSSKPHRLDKQMSSSSHLDGLEENRAESPSLRRGQDLNIWWTRMHKPKHLFRYLQPLERLVTLMPNLFDHTNAEATWPASLTDLHDVGSVCPVCKEERSPSGWGSPGCTECSGVEELCLPVEDHILGPLLGAAETDSVFVEECRKKAEERSDSDSDDTDDT